MTCDPAPLDKTRGRRLVVMSRSRKRAALRRRLERLGLFIPSSVSAVRCNRDRVLQALVHWEGYTSDQSTWEPLTGDKNCPIEKRYREFLCKKTNECADILASLRNGARHARESIPVSGKPGRNIAWITAPE